MANECLNALALLNAEADILKFLNMDFSINDFINFITATVQKSKKMNIVSTNFNSKNAFLLSFSF